MIQWLERGILLNRICPFFDSPGALLHIGNNVTRCITTAPHLKEVDCGSDQDWHDHSNQLSLPFEIRVIVTTV